MMDACGECRFWHEEAHDSARGECRRRAPPSTNQAFLFQIDILTGLLDVFCKHLSMDWPKGIGGEVTETSNSAMFPVTYVDEWCGEWEPKGKPKTKNLIGESPFSVKVTSVRRPLT